MKNSQKLILAAITLIIIAFAITIEPIQLITVQANPLPAKPSPKPTAKPNEELVLNIRLSGTSNYHHYDKHFKTKHTDTLTFHYECNAVYDAGDPEKTRFAKAQIKSHNYTFTLNGSGELSGEKIPANTWKINTKSNLKIPPHIVDISTTNKYLTVDVIPSLAIGETLEISGSGCEQVISGATVAFHNLHEAFNHELLKGFQGNPNSLPFHSANITYFDKGFSATRETTIKREYHNTGTGEKTGDVTAYISFSVRKEASEPEPELEAVIIPGKEYPNWLPEGEEAKPLDFKVELREKGKKQPSDKHEAYFNFELIDVSKQPGTCLNSPASDSDTPSFDLEFDPAGCINTDKPEPGAQSVSTNLSPSAQVRIKSTDWGAYGRLKVTAVTKKGQKLTAYMEGNPKKTELTIPLDNNNNKIADAWEKSEGILEKNLTPQWDKESVPGNNFNGDGLTLFEEYRGIIANRKHTRLSPTQKDLIIQNKIGPEAIQGLQLFEKLAKVKITKVKEGELPENRIINKNPSLYREGDQHGLILVNDVVSTISGEIGVSEPENLIKTSPKDCTVLKIDMNQIYSFRDKINKSDIEKYPDLVKATIESILACTIAHEIGHACSLQHHGKKSHGGVQISCSDKREIYDINGNRVQIKRGEVFIIKSPVGDPAGESSGDVDCIMCYRNVYNYVLKRSETGLEQYYEVPPLPGIHISEYTLCKSAQGTGYNAPDYPRGPVFGNAANGGNCFSKVRIRDFDHPR